MPEKTLYVAQYMHKMYCHIEQIISMSLYYDYFMFYIHVYYEFLIVNKAFV